jgi:cytochrome c
MKKTFFLLMALIFQFKVGIAADIKPEEVYNKVKEAYYFLTELKQAGIMVFNDKHGQFSWKNTYVFVLNCATQTLIAHPKSSDFEGSSIAHIQDKKGLHYLREACLGANSANGIWIEYWWEKQNQKKLSRRILYMISVPAINLQVAASINNSVDSLENLKKIDHR